MSIADERSALGSHSHHHHLGVRGRGWLEPGYHLARVRGHPVNEQEIETLRALARRILDILEDSPAPAPAAKAGKPTPDAVARIARLRATRERKRRHG